MAASSSAAEHLQALIACPSVTPEEGGAHAYLENVLAPAGFTIDRLTFSADGTADVENLFATHGESGRHLVFAGHTDVVPPGNPEDWQHPPFGGVETDGVIHGRGAVDMKGGIACFLAAALDWLGQPDRPDGRISLLITGDEEGPAINGTVKLLDWALAQRHAFDAALVGEPTCRNVLGDTVKIGRRGSLSGIVTVTGQQGHAAYPELSDNPLPRLVDALSALANLELDTGTDAFQPTNLELTSIDTGNAAANVTPGAATARFNIRHNDIWTVETLQRRIEEVVTEACPGEVKFDWILPAPQVFLTRDERLIGEISSSVHTVTGVTPEPTTGGGTSDARFFKDVCPVVEFGLVGQTMHQVDERVPVEELERLTAIYRDFLDRFFAT